MSHRNNNKIEQEIVKKVLSPDLHVLALVTLCYAININVIWMLLSNLSKFVGSIDRYLLGKSYRLTESFQVIQCSK